MNSKLIVRQILLPVDVSPTFVITEHILKWNQNVNRHSIPVWYISGFSYVYLQNIPVKFSGKKFAISCMFVMISSAQILIRGSVVLSWLCRKKGSVYRVSKPARRSSISQKVDEIILRRYSKLSAAKVKAIDENLLLRKVIKHRNTSYKPVVMAVEQLIVTG